MTDELISNKVNFTANQHNTRGKHLRKKGLEKDFLTSDLEALDLGGDRDNESKQDKKKVLNEPVHVFSYT